MTIFKKMVYTLLLFGCVSTMHAMDVGSSGDGRKVPDGDVATACHNEASKTTFSQEDFLQMQNGDEKTLCRLLGAGLDPNATSDRMLCYEQGEEFLSLDKGTTLLGAYAFMQKPICVSVLLAMGAHPNKMDDRYFLPIVLVYGRNDFVANNSKICAEIAKILFKAGTKLGTKGVDGLTSLERAKKGGATNLQKLVEELAMYKAHLDDPKGWRFAC